MKYIRYIIINTILLLTFIIILIDISYHNYGRLFTNLLVIPTMFIPYLFDKTIFKLEEKELLLYYIFIFIAQFLGSIVNLYNYVWWFDLFAHFLSGIFGYMLSIFILHRLKLYNKNNYLFNILFSFGLLFLIAGVWEIIEYLTDIIFNSNLQHHLDTGVKDTMEDIIIAFFGGVIAHLSKVTIDINSKL